MSFTSAPWQSLVQPQAEEEASEGIFKMFLFEWRSNVWWESSGAFAYGVEAKASNSDCFYFVKQLLHMDPERGYDVAKDYCITLW